MDNIIFGRFFPGNSFIHKLDPRIKIVSLLILLTSFFVVANYFSLVINLAFVVFSAAMTKISAKIYFKSLKFILFVVLVTSVLNIFHANGTAIFDFGPIVITKEGLENSFFVTIRLISLILTSSLLTFTTSPTDLTYAIEKLLKPLSFFKVKVHDLAMMLSISLRFIPTLLEETNKIMDAQKARGADMESGNFLKKMRAFVPILVPLLVSSFKRAYDLAVAMECRCYNGGEGRTRFKILHINLRDVLAIVVVFMILIFTFFGNVFF